MRVVVVPQLRNSVLEWPQVDSIVFYCAERAETDQEFLSAASSVNRLRLGSFIRAVLRTDVSLLELAEPMWIREWPRQFFLGALAMTLRSLAGRPLLVGVYAIENLDGNQRFTVPAFDRMPRLNAAAARVIALAVDVSAFMVVRRIVFGTPQARANYAASLPRTFRRVDSIVIPPDTALCRCVGPVENAETSRGVRYVQFLGEGSPRKGLHTLLKAWADCDDLAADGWRLRLTGPGVEAWSCDSRSVDFEGKISRTEVYSRLAAADVVVLPSERQARWREQIGLPTLEALKHGRFLVMSTESGMSELLRHREDVIMVRPGDAATLAMALRDAARRSGALRSLDLGGVHDSAESREAVWRWLGRGGTESQARG